ncbi:hypothetical protein DPMN_191947 [Dreissena polymorpha]|uniref:Uncharacterized protein n=1 Tax=Dreissena polymorpha TaxID=45954 RepID=A0A9D3Y1S2_DREPO|nr:hypothetical protein DPMN_191947 [Dreissena polymorpha]
MFHVQLYRLTFWTRHSKKPRLDIDSMHAEYSSSSSETSSESHEREMQVLKQTGEQCYLNTKRISTHVRVSYYSNTALVLRQ